MSTKSMDSKARRRFLSGVGVVATGATLASTARAADNSETRFTPVRHAQDAWLDVPSEHRAFIDSSTTLGGITALNYANNILFAHAEDYAGNESDYGLVVCFRHQSTPFGYNDSIWAKYGNFFSTFLDFKDPRSDESFTSNPLNQARSDFFNKGNTIDSLIARGVSFVICNKATRAMAGRLAGVSSNSVEEVYQDLRANNITNSRYVAAGVIATTRSQEYGYSLLYAG
jgi:intracellular sulfur oxidation DsrE/DsrF family protein